MERGTGGDDVARLREKIRHVVVLMMENRSFDHMLGYLKLDDVNQEVDGLDEAHGNEDAEGTFHRVAPIGRRLIQYKALDPGHGGDDVKKQLADRNGGFVKNFEEVFERHQASGEKKFRVPEGYEFDPTIILGYQRAEDVPVYDFIARQFQVCDRWFSSVPGPTWPNRLFSIAGRSGPKATPRVADQIPEFLKDLPIYDERAFVHHLDRDQWRWYSHDPGTLRLVDSTFRPGGQKNDPWDRNFAYFNRKTLTEWQTFLDDAAEDRPDRDKGLRAVSWIDPNFVDFRLWGPPGSNDDHPPARVMLGQELVLTVLKALASSERWDDTLFVITYDEHGGFYDHVIPGDHEVPGDPEASFGVRVPAMVISPHVRPGVCHEVFDHTSIVKTILLLFAKDPDEALAAMGPRVENANHLGLLLSDEPPRKRPSDTDLRALEKKVNDWKRAAYQQQLLEEPTAGERAFEAVSDLQSEIVGGSLALRLMGLLPGRP